MPAGYANILDVSDWIGSGLRRVDTNFGDFQQVRSKKRRKGFSPPPLAHVNEPNDTPLRWCCTANYRNIEAAMMITQPSTFIIGLIVAAIPKTVRNCTFSLRTLRPCLFYRALRPLRLKFLPQGSQSPTK